jgi:hypothetical protein
VIDPRPGTVPIGAPDLRKCWRVAAARSLPIQREGFGVVFDENILGAWIALLRGANERHRLVPLIQARES